jgi:Tfp pilus assembly protein PilF
MQRLLIISASLLLALALVNAHAAGGGGGGGGGGESVSEAVAADPDYHAGIEAAKKQDWKEVAVRMTTFTARHPDSADGWNELGHANRMLGDMDSSFRNYAKALQLDPKHRDAHEYLGEAYLQVGDVSRAEQELRTLGSLCFLPCEQYSDLKEQVRRYKIEHSTAAR